MDHHTPEFRFPFRQGNRCGEAVAGHQPTGGAAAPALQPPHDEGAAMGGHHHQARPGFQAAVDHQQVAIEDAVPGHGIAAHPHEEGGEGAGDQGQVEVDAGLHVVVRGAGESGSHVAGGQGTGAGAQHGRQGKGNAPGQCRHSAPGWIEEARMARGIDRHQGLHHTRE